jgi:hypothetical protein
MTFNHGHNAIHCRSGNERSRASPSAIKAARRHSIRLFSAANFLAINIFDQPKDFNGLRALFRLTNVDVCGDCKYGFLRIPGKL